MRLLFLTGQMPYPPHGGGALRTFGLIKGLHAAGHKIDLITLGDVSQAEIEETPLDELCGDVIAIPKPEWSTNIRARARKILTTTDPDMQGRAHSRQFEIALRHQLEANHYDVIQIESLEMATYLEIIKQYANGAKVIYDSFNAEFELQRVAFVTDLPNVKQLPNTIYSLNQWWRLRQFESDVCRKVDHVIAVSDADAAAFHRLVRNVHVSVVPNGIDVDEYTRPDLTEKNDMATNALLFTGSMNYRPNVDAILWFATYVMPKITAKVPDARLWVVGNRPHGKLDILRSRPDIKITGFVPAVQPYLYNATVYVAPLRMGSGTRLKLLQAMAAGDAIVSTPLGAMGLDVQSGREMLLEKNATRFAESVVRLLHDPQQRAALAAKAQTRVRQEYDWSVIIPRLLTIYRELGIG